MKQYIPVGTGNAGKEILPWLKDERNLDGFFLRGMVLDGCSLVRDIVLEISSSAYS